MRKLVEKPSYPFLIINYFTMQCCESTVKKLLIFLFVFFSFRFFKLHEHTRNSFLLVSFLLFPDVRTIIDIMTSV